MRSERDWMRLGSEAESEDRRRGNVAPATDEGLRAVLGDYYADDLNNPEICDDTEAAKDALVEGYRKGG